MGCKVSIFVGILGIYWATKWALNLTYAFVSFLFYFRRINYAQVPGMGARKMGPRAHRSISSPVPLSSAQQGAIKSNQRDDISVYISTGGWADNKTHQI